MKHHNNTAFENIATDELRCFRILIIKLKGKINKQLCLKKIKKNKEK